MISEIGEAGLLQIVQRYCPSQVVGDDAAVLEAPKGQLVVTTDVLVEGVHFSDLTTPPYAVGWRSVAANLSDLAAMGSRPQALVIGLGLPSSTPIAWVEELYRGMQACSAGWGSPLVGGDLCRSPHRFVAITALGEVPPGRAIQRKFAQPGDWLVVTGPHGDARAGLELLLHPEQGSSATAAEREWLIKAHQYPRPRLDTLPILDGIPDPLRMGGMDTSDGLADALVQLCQASGVTATVDEQRIPISAALRQVFPEQALEWALYGGEDFELLLSLEPGVAQQLLDRLPGSVCIGQVTGWDPEGTVRLRGGGILSRQQAFQHF
ncbi:thiamine-phosphate kinase [Synechococcus bigranulatus str. 'Rupite']|uniref:Thiamine-monophosphate kinase n=1 Tax=Thermostichus vulcanus str. 'Rupite' TaxID=2813851 RepID=A0ABT0CCJ4_THEVL|nr:thiamine-phosphate kinase [Thermostichus vulcanus str. 'Rupite']